MASAERAAKKSAKKQKKAEKKAAEKDYERRHAQHERNAAFAGLLTASQVRRNKKSEKTGSKA
jgi:hypothetical protein